MEADPSVYFVHSHHAVAERLEDVAAEREHAGPFAALVWRENLTACQFHPEKSQKVGLAMYANFVVHVIEARRNWLRGGQRRGVGACDDPVGARLH